MVIASADPAWLHTIGQIAGTLLLLELSLVLFVVLAFAVALALAAWWLRHRALPVLDEYTAKVREAMGTAEQGTDRLVQGVAEFHGRTQAVRTIARALLFGRAARPVPVVPRGSAQRGVTTPVGLTGVEGFAPQELPVDKDLSTRDLTAADLAPLGGRDGANGHTAPRRP